jgi:hypothetical protein
MQELLRERLARIEKANEAIALARKSAEIIVDEFVERRSFSDLVSRAREEHEAILSEFGADSSAVITYVTDAIQARWEDGNRIIIEEAGRIGIESHPNDIGKRLQARDCLNQILATSLF